MAWSFNDLSLATGSVVTGAQTTHSGLTLEMLVTTTEHTQIRELGSYAGAVERVEFAFNEYSVIDTTGGKNTIYFTSNSDAHAPSGWYAIDGVNGDHSSTGHTKARVQLNLVRLATSSDATGSSVGSTEFLSHDF